MSRLPRRGGEERDPFGRRDREDAALALLLWAVISADVTSHDMRGPLWANLLMAAALALPFAARRRRPALLLGLFAVLVCVQTAFLVTPGETVSPLMLALLVSYNAGAHIPDRAGLVALGVLIAMICVVALLMGDSGLGDYAFPGLLAGMAWTAGRLVAARTRLAAELHETAVVAEEARERRADEAVAEERRRIARELHDVVAHSMSVMVVQAGGARRILDRDPERAQEAAAQIESTGREALAEMRRLLGVLRPDGEPALAPQPGLDGIGALVDRARAAGLPVDLTVEGERPPVPAGVDLTGYRIVQEGLTNAIKHADSAPTAVRVRYAPDAVELSIEDRGGTSRALAGAGHGLLGMRERCRVVGGELDAGPRAEGGFAIRARIPLDHGEHA